MSFTSSQTIGEYKHSLTANEMPAHQHNLIWNWSTAPEQGTFHWAGIMQDKSAWQGGNWVGGTTGGNQPHNNIQPSICVYFWRHIA